MLTQSNVGLRKILQCCRVFFPGKKINYSAFLNSFVNFEGRSYLYIAVPISGMQREGRRNCQWRVVLYKIK